MQKINLAGLLGGLSSLPGGITLTVTRRRVESKTFQVKDDAIVLARIKKAYPRAGGTRSNE